MYAAMTKDEAQRRRWTFYEAVMFGCTSPIFDGRFLSQAMIRFRQATAECAKIDQYLRYEHQYPCNRRTQCAAGFRGKESGYRAKDECRRDDD